MGLSSNYVVDIIQEKGLVTEKAICTAKESAGQNNDFRDDRDHLLKVLISNGDISTQEINQVLADEYDIRVIDLSRWESSAEDFKIN